MGARRTRGWYLIRVEMAVAVAAILIAAFAAVAAPTWSRGLFHRTPWYEEIVPWVGVLGLFVGLAWMRRIGWPKAAETTWRYRAR